MKRAVYKCQFLESYDMPFINIGTVVPFPAHIVQEAGAYSGEMEGGGGGPPPKKRDQREKKNGKIFYFVGWENRSLVSNTYYSLFFSFRDKRESNMYNMYIWCLLSTPLGGGILSKDIV